MIINSNTQEVAQPRLLSYEHDNVLNVIIAGLALGGAEKIVIDWVERTAAKWQVHIIVLRDHEQEWQVPPRIRVTRLHNSSILERLEIIGADIAAGNNKTVLCHLLKESERAALVRGGAIAIPVLHNAKQGWIEDSSAISTATHVICVSEACEQELSGYVNTIARSVIRHIPRKRNFASNARAHFRNQWNIPETAKVIGMVGAIKPQKNYEYAMQILQDLNRREPVYLVILGGPVGRHGRSAWNALMEAIARYGVRSRVAVPGFICDAMQCLPAFDVLLNTSHYEGFSMATLEAVMHGMPVVASRVGGQAEMATQGLTLVDADASLEDWTQAVTQVLGSRHDIPTWANFPAFRLWTLATLARASELQEKTLFVTANLNSGGAQRSLVNLTMALYGMLDYEVIVTGNSSSDYFYNQLNDQGVSVLRSADSRDAFDHAEVLVKKIVDEGVGTVCFWNLDSKIKLLLVKALAHTRVVFVDVSPGNNSFDELEAMREFQHLIAFDSIQYYGRLDHLVLKYHSDSNLEYPGTVSVIPNGIPLPVTIKESYTITGNPRIVVNGRITPTKFIKEIIQSMDTVWSKIPNAELHLYGGAETKVEQYATEVAQLAHYRNQQKERIFFHGPTFGVKELLFQFDVYVVLGKDQGCPNALLEALSVGLPAIGNDDGGTREQLINGETGILLSSCDPVELGQGITTLLNDRRLAQQLGEAARVHVTESFSMEKMVARYMNLLVREPVTV